MKNPFKRNKYVTRSESHHILSGQVEFVKGNKILKGIIFGKPSYSVELFGNSRWKYYVRTDNDNVFIIEENAIQEIKETK